MTASIDIIHIDYAENDAILVVEGEHYYFQFEHEPTLEAALVFMFREGHLLLTKAPYGR
jgi:hypothetical protein